MHEGFGGIGKKSGGRVYRLRGRRSTLGHRRRRHADGVRFDRRSITMADFVPPAHNSDSPFADMRGRHVAVRTPSLAEAKEFYVGKLDFRVVAEWPFADEQLAYLAPPTDDQFYVEVLGGGETFPTEVRPYTDLGDSLKYRGYHHFCLNVTSVDATIAILRSRGVVVVTEPFVLPAISRKLAFFADPFGNLIELAEVLA
jgi:catechol 2,3-dioxygenase-like lactoylglutathione lyase family enzyme